MNLIQKSVIVVLLVAVGVLLSMTFGGWSSADPTVVKPDGVVVDTTQAQIFFREFDYAASFDGGMNEDGTRHVGEIHFCNPLDTNITVSDGVLTLTYEMAGGTNTSFVFYLLEPNDKAGYFEAVDEFGDTYKIAYSESNGPILIIDNKEGGVLIYTKNNVCN